MAVIIVCIALVLAGLVVVVRWGRLAVEPPPFVRAGYGWPDEAAAGPGRALLPSPRWSCCTGCWSPPWPGGSADRPAAGGRARRHRRPRPLLLLLLLAPVALLAAIVGVVVVVASRIPQVVAAVQSPRLVVVGRAAPVVACLLVVPGFVSTVVTIVGRGPARLGSRAR
jgi:hypothetical protein